MSKEGRCERDESHSQHWVHGSGELWGVLTGYVEIEILTGYGKIEGINTGLSNRKQNQCHNTDLSRNKEPMK